MVGKHVLATGNGLSPLWGTKRNYWYPIRENSVQSYQNSKRHRQSRIPLDKEGCPQMHFVVLAMEIPLPKAVKILNINRLSVWSCLFPRPLSCT